MALTRFVGRTCKLEGITPKEHINVAPTTTNCGIPLPSLVFTPKHIRIMSVQSTDDRVIYGTTKLARK